MPLVVVVLLPAPLSLRLATIVGGGIPGGLLSHAETPYLQQPPHMRHRKHMSELGALVDMRQALGRLGVPLAALHCAPQHTELTLQHWVALHKTHMIVTDSLRSPWAAAGAPAVARGEWQCPVHGVDSDHIFPPHLHAAASSQSSMAENIRATRCTSQAQLTPFRYPAASVFEPACLAAEGSDMQTHTASAGRSTHTSGTQPEKSAVEDELPGLRAVQMAVQLPLFRCRSDNFCPASSQKVVTGSGGGNHGESCSSVLQDCAVLEENSVALGGTDWVLHWPLFVPPRIDAPSNDAPPTIDAAAAAMGEENDEIQPKPGRHHISDGGGKEAGAFGNNASAVGCVCADGLSGDLARAVAEASDWEEAREAVVAHAVWQTALGEPPKTISLTASFSSAAASASSTHCPASPLCTQMGEGRALAVLFQVCVMGRRMCSRVG